MDNIILFHKMSS